MSASKFKFLKDAPIGKESQGFFDFYHKNIAPALKTIVENDSCVHTVGLFGKWGSGKSTIIKLLKEGGVEDATIVEFDCWKYEKDSLRRQLLLQIAKDLGVSRKNIDELEKELYFSLSETINEKVSISWGYLKKVALISFAFLLPVGFITWQIFPDVATQWKLWVGTSFSLVLSIALLVEKVLGDDFKKIIMVSPITASKAQLSSPEQFERSFIKILKTTKIDKQKIIIVIDNLDRVESKVATEVLATLKTFLEISEDNLGKKKVIFLVPCDFDAIKKSAPSAELADEFLRKIFNVVIWTPEFIDVDIRTFIKEQISQTGDIKTHLDEEDVILVIDSAFANSPREIKQFINNLISSLIVASETEVKDIVEKNVAYMAKVLVLMHKYPKAFQNLKKLWYAPEEIINTYEEVLIKHEKEEFNEGFKNFMLSTSRITVLDAEPFIYLKKPVVSNRLTNADPIRLSLIEAKETEAKDLVQSETDKVALVEFIISILNKYQNQPEILKNVFITQLSIFKELNISITKNYLNKVGSLLDGKVWPYFQDLKTDLIFSFIIADAQLEQNLKKNILERYVLALTSTEEFKNFQKIEIAKLIIKSLIEHQNLLTPDQKIKFAQSIEQIYTGKEDVIELFVKADDRGQLITKKTLEQVITGSTLENFSLRKDLFVSFQKLISLRKLFSLIYVKLSELLSQHNTKQPAFGEEKEQYLKQVLELISKYKDDLAQVPKPDVIELVRLNIQTFNNISSWDQRITIINILQHLQSIADDGQKAEIGSLLSQFIQNATPATVQKMFAYWKITYIQSLITKLLTQLQPRISSDKIFAKVIYDFASTETRLAILKYLITNEHDATIDFIGTLAEGDFNRVEVVKMFLDKAKTLQASDRVRIYDFISEKISINDEVAIKDLVVEQIRELLNQDEQNVSKVGFDFFCKSDFLGEAKKRDAIIKPALEYLRQAGKTITEQNSYTLKAIASFFNKLQETPQKDFVYSLFNMLRPDRNMQTIETSLENLLLVKPAFGTYEKDYKDLLESLKNWTQENTKTKVIEAIVSLKSLGNLSTEEKDFWNSVDELLPKKGESEV
ncbi:MAG: KAP family NTPase [Candidatus Pacebacteria bacterium]|nr:KAP family NTPase [Candidatus Paceibacterota bacterium]